jgi:type IV pilus assembly protein PilC
VEDGNSISGAFQDNKNVPKIVPQMMNVGEKTGKLDEVLKRITEFYTREIDNTVANLMTLMEPLIMIIMGIGVGIMVAAIILPMYQMAQGY